MIEEAIFAILTGYAGLSALIADRAYPVLLPQDVGLPALTYTRITTGREYSHDGPSGLAAPLWQIDCWATDPLTAKQVKAQVLAAMHGTRHSTVSGVAIGSVTCTDEQDKYDDAGKVVGVQLDFEIWHEE